MEIIYPSVEDVINANKKAVELLRATKAEKHEVLAPRYKIEEAIERAKSSGDNLKKKAAILLMEINRKHFFASANKRTSFIVAADFLLANEGRIPLKKKENVKFLIEIREGKRTLEEIVRWLDE
ncbi:MAG: type II toxin-antitoxin system death-on-curing family toxin [Candidatus Aenigmarchaeota archaeon]|nr:type II toxin-antitoxin system death-on-curing family toxin [Candidatus Aenigmarchaeota archaeon]